LSLLDGLRKVQNLGARWRMSTSDQCAYKP
jgi:hypothetical protein